jgi:hypothetical protein
LDCAVRLCELGDPDGFRQLRRISKSSPGFAAAHAALAKLSWAFTGDEDIAHPFLRAMAAEPDNPDLHVGLIALLMQAGRYDAAADRIRAARSALGPAQWFDEAEAVCASETGDVALAERLFSGLPFTAPIDTARARHCLRNGHIGEAAAAAARAVASPDGRSAWPYLGLAWRMLEDSRWIWLEGNPRLIGIVDLGLSVSELGALRDYLRKAHLMRNAPLDQSLRGGTQTPGSILEQDAKEIATVRQAIIGAISTYLKQLPPHDAAHPTLRTSARAFEFAGSWSSLLRDGGFHTSHIHPAGWLSSAFYVSLPESKQLGNEHDGWLQFGSPPAELGLDVPPFRLVEPKAGHLVLFPSTTWHDTLPFRTGERLTIAFDLVPARHDPS